MGHYKNFTFRLRKDKPNSEPDRSRASPIFPRVSRQRRKQQGEDIRDLGKIVAVLAIIIIGYFEFAPTQRLHDEAPSQIAAAR